VAPLCVQTWQYEYQTYTRRQILNMGQGRNPDGSWPAGLEYLDTSRRGPGFLSSTTHAPGHHGHSHHSGGPFPHPQQQQGQGHAGGPPSVALHSDLQAS
jgi:hypothetical protein